MLRNFPPADQCDSEDLDNLADLVVRDPRASYDLAGSRAHIEALCRRYQALAQDLAAMTDIRDAARRTLIVMERSLAAATNDLDAARTEIRALASTLDHERNVRQGEVLAAEADRERADRAEAAAEVFEMTARAIRARHASHIDLAELVHAVNGRLSRALVRERAISAALGARCEQALQQIEEREQTDVANERLQSALADACLGITGQTVEQVNIQLDAELAAHPEPGPLHHARDQRDQEDSTP